ncbi:MAG: T9SS type A sorting domain-containing protein, partial [Gemmatimonadota bacterium]
AADRVAPAAPTGPVAQLAFGGGVRVSWTPPPDTDVGGYRVYRALGSGAFAAVAGPVAASSYLDMGQAGGVQLRYYVTALDGARPANESAPSPTATISVASRPGDFLADGVVDFGDFFLFADHFGRRPGDAEYDALFDFTGDDAVDYDDFFTFVDLFGSRYGSARPAAPAGARQMDLILTVESLDLGDGYTLVVATPNGGGSRGFGLRLTFDPAAVEFRGATAGLQTPAPGAPALFAVFPQEPGQVAIGGYLPQGAIDGATALARLRFEVKEGGAAAVEISEVSTAPAAGPAQTYSPSPGELRAELRPTRVGLLQNYPNPFNPQTEIRYQLPEAMPVSLRLYDVLGQEVAVLVSPDAPQSAGTHRVVWQGRDNAGRPVASGIYFYVLETTGFRQVRKLLLLR